MADLNKEVWVEQLKENFYPDSSFLKYVRDFSTLVENDAINMASAGVDPNQQHHLSHPRINESG